MASSQFSGSTPVTLADMQADTRTKRALEKVAGIYSRLCQEEGDLSALIQFKNWGWDDGDNEDKKAILQSLLEDYQKFLNKNASSNPQASSEPTEPPDALGNRFDALIAGFDGLILGSGLGSQVNTGTARLHIQKLRQACEQELAPLAVPGRVTSNSEIRNTADGPSYSSFTEYHQPIEHTPMACIVDAGVECSVCADLRQLFAFPLPVPVKVGETEDDEGDDKTENKKQESNIDNNEKRKKKSKKRKPRVKRRR
ncbi:hypothetical protein GGR58DRAFT_523243 [Xylaria digitata]|nr:hypothetical protein GGR58DRAFT_523243 [Xylaria digitata]